MAVACEAVVGAASESFGRWLHHRRAFVAAYSGGISSHRAISCSLHCDGDCWQLTIDSGELGEHNSAILLTAYEAEIIIYRRDQHTFRPF